MDVTITPFWNKKELNPPAIQSLKLSCKNPEKTSASLAQILENITSVLNDQDLLHHDAALISRLLFRTKRTMRHHKGYKCFQKVRQCLSNYLSLDLLSTITQVRHSSYGTFGPSREVLEWGLVSLQRFSALFHRLQKTCFESAYHMHNHIRTGDNWHLALLFLACLSRVWTISHFLISQACEWYVQLKPFLPLLQSSGNWLPSDYQLPEDLQSWLGHPDYLEKKSVSAEKDMTVQTTSSAKVNVGLSFNEDLGEIVSRPNANKNDQMKNIEIILSKCEDITAFMKTEQLYRTSKSPKSKTKKLRDAEWQHLRNYLKKTYIQLKSTKDRNVYEESIRIAQEKLDKWINKR